MASQLRQVISTVEKYTTAVNTFRLKYDSIPGDIPNATNYFGVASSCQVSTNNTGNVVANPSNVNTCNGNGDGHLSFWASYASPNEGYIFWQHLSLAKLVNGNFSGAGEDSGYQGSYTPVPGLNVPSLSYDKTVGIDAQWEDPTNEGNYPSRGEFLSSYMSTGFPIYYGNVFIVGKRYPGQGETLTTPAFTPNQAKSIDQKIDDGKPFTGNILTHYGNSLHCINWPSSVTGVYENEYDTAFKTPQCVLDFANRF